MFNWKEKLTTAFVVMAVFAGHNAHAQNDEKFKSISLKAGYIYATQKMELRNFNNTESTAGHGFYVGYAYENRFAERFGFALEGIYENVNSTIKSSSTNAEAKVNRGLVKIPLGLKIYPTYDLSLFLGGYISWGAHHKVSLSSTTLGATELATLEKNVKEEAKDVLKNSDYGLRFGADYRVYDELHIEAFYNLGSKNKGKDYNQNTYQLNYLSLGLNYRF